MKKENGDRAVGTQLAADHPGQAVLRRGEAYKGPAMLFGRRFYTAYHPVFNPAGKVVGIIYVGIAMENSTACCGRRSAPWPSLPASPPCLRFTTMALVRRVTKPLGP